MQTASSVGSPEAEVETGADRLGGVTSMQTLQKTRYHNESSLDPRLAARLKRDGNGLVAAVIQAYDTLEVLMVGYMDDEAFRRTITTGRVTFWSRSRQEYWRKGDTSGHVQYVKSVNLDCDGDAILVKVDQVGAACHTGARSCFDAGGPIPAVRGNRTTKDDGGMNNARV